MPITAQQLLLILPNAGAKAGVFAPVQPDQLGREMLGRMRAVGLDRPVFVRLERLDLLLALDDHAQRRRLHAAGRQPALHLAPQHRREVEADQVVERAPRLLGVDQVHRDPAWLRHRFLDRARRDLGEHHPVRLVEVVEQAVLLEDLRDVPADRLALAVRVGGEVEVVGGLGGLDDGGDVLLVLLDQLVAHPEAVVRIDRALLGHQVADMAIRGEDLEVLAEVLVDRLGLGGRLDDEEVLGHRGWFRARLPATPFGGIRGTRRPGDPGAWLAPFRLGAFL